MLGLPIIFSINISSGWGTEEEIDWLDGWSYRKGHIIQGSPTETVSNYSIGVKVYYRSGVDGAEEVLGNTYGSVYLDEKCENDFADIRFTSSDGVTPLDFWIEEKEESSYATIWVEVHSIPKDPDSTVIYIYYGNPQASSSDNMKEVFVDSDGFEDTDFSEWRVEKSSGDILEPSDDYVKHGQYSLKHDDDGGTDVVRIAKDDRSYSSHSVNVWMYSGIGQQTGNCLVIISDGGLRSVIGEIDSISGSHFSFRESSMAIGAYSPSNVEQTEGWHKVEIQTANDGFRGYIDGVLIFSENSARTIEIVSIGTYWTALGNAAYFDSFHVRKFIDPEPIHVMWRSEETYLKSTTPDEPEPSPAPSPEPSPEPTTSTLEQNLPYFLLGAAAIILVLFIGRARTTKPHSPNNTIKRESSKPISPISDFSRTFTPPESPSAQSNSMSPPSNKSQNPYKSTSKLGTAIIDGRTVYSRRFSQSPAMLERRASEHSIEEAWTILRSDFWDTKRKTLAKLQPEILSDILYWESHLDEYYIYMNMKLLFDIPYLEHDFWVRRNK